MFSLANLKNTFLNVQNNADKFQNHLFVLYVFFLPLTGPTSTVFFIILILFFIKGNLRENIYTSLSNKVIFSFFLLFLLSALWILGSDDFSNIPIELKRMKVFLYPIIFFSFLKPTYVPKATLAFMIGMLVSEITSYAIFFQLIDPIFYKGYPTFDPSPFLHHSHYGLLLALTSGVLLYRLIVYKDSIFLRFTSLIFFITVTINIFITGGRMGYVLYILAILTILTMQKIKIYKTLIVTLIISVSVFTLAYQFSPLFQKRLVHTVHGLKQLQTDHPFNSSFGTRLGFIYYAIPTINENFFLGVGTGDHIQTVHNEIKKQNETLSDLSSCRTFTCRKNVLALYGQAARAISTG